MKINHLTIVENKQSLVETHLYESRKILIESMSGLSIEQKKIVQGIYNEFEPLIREIKLTEATLSADQIQKIFGNVEQQATAAGGNRTMLGKGKDVAVEASKILDKVGGWLQDTKPVKAFDNKFEKLKADIRNKAGEDSKFIKTIDKLGQFAKENPGKTAAIVGILTAIASIAGGPMGGAIAGQVLRGSVELLKGEKLSTAIGKGIKTAAFGFLAGAALQEVGDALANLRADVVFQDTFAEVSFNATREMSDGYNTFFRTLEGVNVKVLPEDAKKINDIMAIIGGSDDPKGKVAAWYRLQQIAAEIKSGAYRDVMREAGVRSLKNDDLLNAIKTASKGVVAAAQGAVAGGSVKGDAKEKNESVDFFKTKLSEGQVYLLFNKIEQHEILREAPEQDATAQDDQNKEKKPGFLARVGKNLTTKITADKLNKAWKKAGSPTDSDQIAQIMRDQGVNDEVIAPVYKQMKLKVPAAPKQSAAGATQDGATPAKGGTAQAGGTTGGTAQAGGKTPPTGKATQAKGYSYNDVKAHIAKLTAKDKRRLLTYISKMQPSKTPAPTKTKPAAQSAGIKQGGYQTTGPKA